MIIDKIKELLKRDGLLVEDKFDEWVKMSRQQNTSLDRVLVSTGYLTEKQMLKIFGECLGLEVKDRLVDVSVPGWFVERVPVQFVRYHNIVAVGEHDGTVQVATCYPLDIHPIDELSSKVDKIVDVVLAPRAEITSLINRAYQQRQDVVDEMLEGLDEEDLANVSKEIEGSQDLLDLANKAPVIKLVNMIVFQALKMRASDIHLQPFEEKLVIRYRIDGILYDMMTPPKKLQEAIVSRIKVMGKMDIAERRMPQDGRSSVRIGDSEIDIRISSVPTIFGERIVLRLLDKSARLYELEEIGLDNEGDLEIVKKLISASHGIILVTGPTGSGKTTTLYASLKRINKGEMNIITIEDPIEYHLPGVSQIEVNAKKGLTFATGLRSIVRQDPDVIMVGEIRDLETATIAIQSALTGHLVFSTLHTNDAASAVTRLLNLGVEPYLVASSVIGVIAQRLVRKICDNCKEKYRPEPEELQQMQWKEADLPGGRLSRGKGCPKCLNSGYYDRTAIYEILPVNDEIRDLVMQRTSYNIIKAKAIEKGMKTLRMDGARKVLRGVTSIPEVLSVTQMDNF